MARIEPLPREQLSDIEDILQAFEARNGFAPNSFMTLGRLPAVARALGDLIQAIDLNSDRLSKERKNLVGQIASRSAGCNYCWAHTARMSASKGVTAEKEATLWDYERSPRFSAAERAALRVAQGAGQVPNEVTDEDFAELKRHFKDDQIVELVAMISLFGFLNRFNDTMAIELEPSATDFGGRHLAAHGWAVGKHA